jgi:IS30 family transposase
MARHYRHLSADERDRLALLKPQGLSIRAMGRALGRDPATISRELARNAAPVYRGVYLPHRAHARAAARSRGAVCHGRLRDRWVRAYVRRQLQRGWSPELIAGRVRRLRPPQAVSHETIYAWLYAEAPELIPCLLRRHRVRRRRGYSRTAGLVRRFFPKRTNFAILRRARVKHVERWLNHRPRRVLDFQTPAEVFRSSVALRP